MTQANFTKPLPAHLKQHRNDVVNSLMHENGRKYNINTWKKAFSSNPTMLSDLAVIGQKCTGTIKRGDISKLVTTALKSRNPSDIRIVFLASQIWGWGNRGTGINNTKRCLSEKNAENILVDSFNKVRDNQIGKAYNNFNLPGCGPAFFTKFFYFIGLGCELKPLPLILDSKVATFLEFLGKQEGWGLSDFALVNRNKKKNNTISNIKRYEEGYIEYIKCMADWDTKLGCNADDIEYYMYRNSGEVSQRRYNLGGVKMSTKTQEFTKKQARDFSLQNSLVNEVNIIDQMVEPAAWKKSIEKGVKGSRYWFTRARIGNHLLLWKSKHILVYPKGRNPSKSWKQLWETWLKNYLNEPEGKKWLGKFKPPWL